MELTTNADKPASSPRPPRKTYAFEDFKAITDGKIELPNFEPLDLIIAIATISAGGGLIYPYQDIRYARVPGDDHPHWARYFLNTGQGGGLDGTGYVIWYASVKGFGHGHAASFAICKHTKVDAPGADHRRGWHPGWCSQCGLDMTVDSGG